MSKINVGIAGFGLSEAVFHACAADLIFIRSVEKLA
jgi:hypothetical protein